MANARKSGKKLIGAWVDQAEVSDIDRCLDKRRRETRTQFLVEAIYNELQRRGFSADAAHPMLRAAEDETEYKVTKKKKPKQKKQ